MRASFVGVDAHIALAGCTVLYGNLRRIRDFPMGRQSRRPLQQALALLVGADDSVRPQDILVLRQFSANSQLPSGPMWASAPTEFQRIRTALHIFNAERFYRRY